MLLLDLFYDNRVKFCLLTIEYNEGYDYNQLHTIFLTCTDLLECNLG